MINDVLKQIFLGNRVLDYVISSAVFLAGLIIVKVFKRFILGRLKKLAEKTAVTIDDFLVSSVQRIVIPLVYFAVFYMSVNRLEMGHFLKKGLTVLGTAAVTLFAARFAAALASYAFNFYWVKRKKDAALERSLNGILRVIKTAIWGLAIIFFLDNLGFKISTVIAGLGIGGVAVALAAQAVLGDLFSYFAILFDRPFEVGDFIITGEYLGTVEYIGIKTTRIRSLGGEQLIFSNSDLTNSRIRNYKRMEKRRVVFKLGVTYQTSLEHLKEAPKIIEKIIKETGDTVFDRAHFASYGDFSLNFEVVYYVLSSDYNKYMDVQQEINFAVKKEFEAKGIDFAYPTQTLYVNKES